MTIPDYLKSEQAREDVGRAIRELATCDGLAYGIDFGWMRAGIIGAWRRVAVEEGRGDERISITAYYRPDGDRFVVTDLGEGVRALRLRTGLPIMMSGQKRVAFCNALQDRLPRRVTFDDMTLFACDKPWSGNPMHWYSVTAPDLPDALCRVMLASLMVAQS